METINNFQADLVALDNIEHWVLGDLEFMICEPDRFGDNYSIDTVHKFIDNVPGDTLGQLIKDIRRHHNQETEWRRIWIDRLNDILGGQQQVVDRQQAIDKMNGGNQNN